MGSVHKSPNSDRLVMDFYDQDGKRHRVKTELKDNAVNRKKLQKHLDKISERKASGTLDLSDIFVTLRHHSVTAPYGKF